MTETPEQKRERHRTLILSELERKSPGEVWPHARVWLGEEEATKLCGPKPTTRVAIVKNKKPPRRPPCQHLGPATGETRPCQSCRGLVNLKVFACDVYERCTLSKRLDGLACCDAKCDSYVTRE